ncbi:hypothetical protein B484DRAFT_459802, partial [Ochromonadaceae sp. CCMP2298]
MSKVNADKRTEMSNISINPTANSSAPAAKGEEEEIDYEAVAKGLNWTEYVQFRCKYSNVVKYYKGTNLSVEEADTVVNTLALVAALILTIPFGAALSFDIGYWDNLTVVMQQCEGVEENTLKFIDVYNLIAHGLYAVAYSSMLTLGVCIFYYILRPSGKYFAAWWHHGKIAVLLAFLGTVIAIISMLTLFGSFMGW